MSKNTSAEKIQNQNKFNRISKALRSLTLAMGLLLMTALPATASEEAQYDDVYFNDYKLGFIEQMALEDHIDRDISDGKYWFELETGMWGPIGGTAIGRIVIPEDYQDYVKSRLFKEDPTTEVQLTASVGPIALKADLNYVKSIHPKQIPATKEVKRSVAVEECDNRCLRVFIEQLVAAFSIPGERKSFLSF